MGKFEVVPEQFLVLRLQLVTQQVFACIPFTSPQFLAFHDAGEVETRLQDLQLLAAALVLHLLLIILINH